MGDTDEEPPDDRYRQRNTSTAQSLKEQIQSWYGTDETQGRNWVEPRTKSVLETIKHEIEERALIREWETRRLRWQRQVTPPKRTEFCPIVHSCYTVGKADKNCFLTKAPGCPDFINYLNETNRSTVITRTDSLKYVRLTPITSF